MAFTWLSLASLTMAILSVTTGWNHLISQIPGAKSDSAVPILAIILFAVPILLLWLIA
jgi:hypothetical protein